MKCLFIKFIHLILILLTGLVFSACKEDESNKKSPPKISLVSSFTFGLGQAISKLPTNSGGALTACSISPTLPQGLSIARTTCEISGTPVALSSRTAYVIKATNTYGSSSITTNIETVTPPSITYASTAMILKAGAVMTSIIAANSGGAIVSCSASPSLPAGLTLNSTNCAIDGTPTSVANAKFYTINATNGDASGAFIISIEIMNPPSITYSPLSVFFGVGISNTKSVMNTGGAIATCFVSPALPSGITLESSTCKISGTPTTVGTATYTITASNAVGTGSVNLTLTTMRLPQISYAAVPWMLVKNAATTKAVISTGGPVSTCTVSPTLPAGLVLSSSTCEISGTPTVKVIGKSYTVTATNAVGSGTTTVTMSILSPPVIAYESSIINLGVDIYHSKKVTNLGDDIVSCAITPSLPDGLLLNATTCEISGFPNLALPSTSYTVTATNAVGTGSVTIDLMINQMQITMNGTCAVVNGGAKCWGYNGYGLIGNNTNNTTLVPVTPTGLGSGVVKVAVGQGHACALMDTGVVKCWGSNNLRQLGVSTYDPVYVPQDVPGLIGVKNISAGKWHNCALMNNGTVKCWGDNRYNQMGNNATTSVEYIPGLVDGLANVVHMVSSQLNTCALISDGTVKCWGPNEQGQLGNNSTAASKIPVTVSGLTSGVKRLAVGIEHACALVNGGVKCWGNSNNTSYAYGNNGASSLVPVDIQGMTSGVRGIATQTNETYILKENSMYAMGSRYMRHDVPTINTYISSDVISMSLGDFVGCTMLAHKIQCWGYGNTGQLGNNSTANSHQVPVDVQGISY